MLGLGRPFQKGQSGNLNGRPKGSLTLPEVRKALTPHASKFIETLVSLLKHSDPRAQLRAIELGMGYLWGKPQERPADEPEQPQSLAQSIPPEERAAVMEFLASFVNQKDAISQMSKEELLARREALLTGNGTAPPGVQPSTEELVRIAKGGA